MRRATPGRGALEGELSFVDAIVTAHPEHLLDRERTLELARDVLRGKVPFLDQAVGLFANAGVDQRYLVRPIDDVLDHHSLKWRNDVYIEECERLGAEVLARLLESTGTDPGEIDVLITTSCTGFMIPSLDAFLINEFRLRPDTRRLPFTELGCAAGAMGLSRAHDHLLAYPDHKVVVVAVEIPSMTYLHRDMSVANLVSAALFGDGAAGALVRGDGGALEIRHTRTHFFYDTPEMMGFDLNDDGFRIVLDKRVSELIARELRPAADAFLDAAGVRLEEIEHFWFHPGGRKVIETLESSLELDGEALRHSRRALAEAGNLSSASLLWVLANALADDPAPGTALLGAFGPGFNAELLLGKVPQR